MLMNEWNGTDQRNVRARIIAREYRLSLHLLVL
jgi:hypothetical protein